MNYSEKPMRKERVKMEYINYRRFKGKAICGNVNIPAMTRFQSVNGMIYYEGKPICVATSANAHNFFARNDDGCGSERGKLVTAINKLLTKIDDKYQDRWDAVWGDDICNQYRRVEHQDHWLWNHAFYNASIDRLSYILAIVESVK